MSEQSDILIRVEAWLAEKYQWRGFRTAEMLREMAAEIARLRAELDAHREAVRVLARVAGAAMSIPSTAALEMEAKGMAYSCIRVANTIEACTELRCNDTAIATIRAHGTEAK